MLLLERFDNITLLDKLQIYNTSNSKLEFNWLLDSGALIFLAGLMLKLGQNINRERPTMQTMYNVLNTLKMYYDHYNFEKQDAIGLEKIGPDAKEFKIRLFLFSHLNHVNYGGYQFQYEDYGHKVFGSLDTFFESKIRFTFKDSLEFSSDIVKYLELKRDKNHSEMIKLDRSKLNAEDIFQIPYFENTIYPKAIEKLFNYSSHKATKFLKFLDYLGVSFGEQSIPFENPMDKNVLFEKPLIRHNQSYYCPFVQLLFDQHKYFANALKVEVINDTQIGEKYKKLKSNYLETKSVEFLKRLFPENEVYSNLHYFPIGTTEDDEADVIIKHGSCILLIEAKSGEISDPALRGAPKSLFKDFNKLIGKAYSQGKRTRDFIINENPAIFYDKKNGKILLEISEGKNYQIIICNVSLYPLRVLATNANDLNTLGIFTTDDRPFYVSLFDLDLLTQFIPSGSVLIDYLLKRLEHNTKTATAFSEIMYLSSYLSKQQFDGIDYSNPKKYHDLFDSFFILSGKKPQFQMEQFFINLIDFLDKSNVIDKVNIIQEILSISKLKLTKLSNTIRQKIKLVEKYSSDQSLNIDLPTHSIQINFVLESREYQDGDRVNKESQTKNHIIVDYETKTESFVSVFSLGAPSIKYSYSPIVYH